MSRYMGSTTTALVRSMGMGLASVSLDRSATPNTIARLKKMLAADVDLLAVMERTSSGEMVWLDRDLSREVIQRCLRNDHNVDRETHREALANKEHAVFIQRVNGSHKRGVLRTAFTVFLSCSAGLALLASIYLSRL